MQYTILDPALTPGCEAWALTLKARSRPIGRWKLPFIIKCVKRRERIQKILS